MLSILLLSHKGEGYETIDRLIKEGHYVKYWTEDSEEVFPQSRATKVHRYDQHLEAADLVIALNSRYGRICDEVRERGKMAVGGRVQELLTGINSYIGSALKLLGINAYSGPGPLNTIILCGWFNGNEWLDTYVVHHHTRMLEGDRGPCIEDMGYIALREQSRITELTSLLKASNYKGFIGVECAIEAEGLEYIRFITTPTTGLLSATLECAKTTLTNIVYSIAAGKARKFEESKHYGISVGLRCLGERNILLPIDGPALKHFWPSADDLIIGYVSARGEDIREARRRVYRTVSNIVTSDVIYRRDIGINSIWDWKEEVANEKEV